MSVDSKALVMKYIEDVDSNIPLQDALKIIHSRIALAMKINETMSENFKEWGIGEFIVCPNCASHTLLEFGGCHWCNYQLLDSTAPSPEVVKATTEVAPATTKEELKPVQAQMGNEPPATINYGGAKKAEETKKVKETKKVEKPVKEVSKETDYKKEVALLRKLAKTAESPDTSLAELKEINELSKAMVNVKECGGKISIFRKSIVDAINNIANAMEVANKPKEEKKEKKPVAKRASKKASKAIEADDDFTEEETPKKSKAPKVVVVEEEDFEADDDFSDEEDVDAEVPVVNEDEDLEGIEAVNLDGIDVSDLEDEDFDLDD